MHDGKSRLLSVTPAKPEAQDVSRSKRLVAIMRRPKRRQLQFHRSAAPPAPAPGFTDGSPPSSCPPSIPRITRAQKSRPTKFSTQAIGMVLLPFTKRITYATKYFGGADRGLGAESAINCVSVSTAFRGCAPMPAGSETDQLMHVGEVGPIVVVRAFELADVDQQLPRDRFSRQGMECHTISEGPAWRLLPPRQAPRPTRLPGRRRTRNFAETIAGVLNAF